MEVCSNNWAVISPGTSLNYMPVTVSSFSSKFNVAKRFNLHSYSLRRRRKGRVAIAAAAVSANSGKSLAATELGKSSSAMEQLDIERGVCVPFRKYTPETVRNKVLESRGAILSLFGRGVEIVWNLGFYWSTLVYDFMAGRDEEVVPYRARQLRNLLCDLGPSFIKAGQVLANRPDIIREDYMSELCILQDDVPAFPNQVEIINQLTIFCTVALFCLGIKSLDVMNKALLGKWVWRYGKEDNSLWKDMVKWKFGEDSGSCGLRKEVWNLMEWVCEKKNPQREKTIFENIGFVVGVGNKIRFWEDKWCGEMELKGRFPNLFRSSLNALGMVVNFTEWDNIDVTWCPTFQRNLRDSEIEEFASSVIRSEA